MADVNINQVYASTWAAVMTDEPVDNILTSQALTYLLTEGGYKASANGGNLFEFSLMYALNTSFKSIGELETVDTARIDTFDAAQFAQKFFAGTIVVSDVEELRNAVEGRKFDVVKQKIKGGIGSAMEQLDVMLNGDGTGNNSKDFDGIQKIISATPTTGTVGGVNAATWVFWRNRQTSGAKTSTAFDNLRTSLESIHNQCSLGGTDRKPTGVYTDRPDFEGYVGLLTTIERLVKDGDNKDSSDLGFLNDAIAFKGIPMVYGENAPAGIAYFVNKNFLKLCYLKGGWMKMKDAVEPANQFASVRKVLTVGNLGAGARRHLGAVTAIS